eukprot:3978283-Alexandrium_andersonii.AAC.1
MDYGSQLHGMQYFCVMRETLLEPLRGCYRPLDPPAGASGASGLSGRATAPPDPLDWRSGGPGGGR